MGTGNGSGSDNVSRNDIVAEYERAKRQVRRTLKGYRPGGPPAVPLPAATLRRINGITCSPAPPPVCVSCFASLTPEVLLDQANEIMQRFAGRELTDEVVAEIKEVLERAAGPLNEGAAVCYRCATVIDSNSFAEGRDRSTPDAIEHLADKQSHQSLTDWGIEADIARMGPVRKGIYIDPERVAAALDAEIRYIAARVDVRVLHAETAVILSTFQLVRRWLLGEELKL